MDYNDQLLNDFDAAFRDKLKDLVISEGKLWGLAGVSHSKSLQVSIGAMLEAAVSAALALDTFYAEEMGHEDYAAEVADTGTHIEAVERGVASIIGAAKGRIEEGIAEAKSAVKH